MFQFRKLLHAIILVGPPLILGDGFDGKDEYTDKWGAAIGVNLGFSQCFNDTLEYNRGKDSEKTVLSVEKRF